MGYQLKLGVAVCAYLLALTDQVHLFALPLPNDHKPLAEYKFDIWTEESGLPALGITAICQSRDGYLWVGTNTGLFRYDGIRFTVYDKNSSPSLPLGRISSIYQDRKGDLLIGTFGGGLARLSAGTITTMKWQDGLPSDYVSAVCEDNKGMLWIGTDGKGVCRITPDTIFQYKDTSGLLSNHITSFAPDQNGIWIGTILGLQRYHEGAIDTFTNSRLPSRHVLSLLADGSDLWIGTTGGLSLLRNDSIITFTRRDGLSSNTIKAIQREREGGLWLATEGGGLVRFANGRFESYVPEGHRSGAEVEAICVDYESSIWAGLSRGGLYRLRDETFSWFSLHGVDDETNTVLVAGTGALWAGTTEGLSAIAPDGSSRMFVPPGRGVSRNVLALYEDRHGVIWFGTRSGDVFTVRGGAVSRAPFQPPDKSEIWQIFSSSDNTMWMGTRKGLWRIRGTHQERFTKDNGLTHDDVRAICEDAHGTMWIGTSYGLNRFQQGEFTQYKLKQGLSNDVIVALHPDANGDLWIGTFDGLNRLRDGVFTHIKVKDGLPDDNILSITEDGLGYFWIASSKGLYRLSKNDVNTFADGGSALIPVTRFDQSDGLKSRSFSGAVQPPAWRDMSGKLWFATSKGIAQVDPGMIRSNHVPPPVIIETISIDRKTQPLNSMVNVGPGYSMFEITYTSPSFAAPEDITFACMLDGFDQDWIDVGTRRTAYFMNVPPGTYHFRVMARNKQGVESKDAASLSMVIYPPFWLTWWFQSIVVFLFLSIGPAIYFRRVTQLKRRHAQQKEFSLRLIASQEAERKRIAAELHDSLGQNIIIIKNRAMLGRQSEGDAASISEQLDEISRTASATLDDMRKIAYNLRPLNLERFGLSETLAQTVRDIAAATGVALQSDIDNIDALLPPDVEMHVFRIVQETLTNIAKHSQAAHGTVSVRNMEGAILLRVSDDGLGYDTTGQALWKGFGLDDIAQRVHLIGGQLLIDSSAGRGTTVNVTIPFSEKTL